MSKNLEMCASCRSSKLVSHFKQASAGLVITLTHVRVNLSTKCRQGQGMIRFVE